MCAGVAAVTEGGPVRHVVAQCRMVTPGLDVVCVQTPATLVTLLAGEVISREDCTAPVLVGATRHGGLPLRLQMSTPLPVVMRWACSGGLHLAPAARRTVPPTSIRNDCATDLKRRTTFLAGTLCRPTMPVRRTLATSPLPPTRLRAEALPASLYQFRRESAAAMLAGGLRLPSSPEVVAGTGRSVSRAGAVTRAQASTLVLDMPCSNRKGAAAGLTDPYYLRSRTAFSGTIRHVRGRLTAITPKVLPAGGTIKVNTNWTIRQWHGTAPVWRIPQYTIAREVA